SGFTWQDDYTQQVIGQELSTIHKIHNRHPDIFASEVSDTGSYIYNDPIRYYMMQKLKERANPLSHASTTHQQHADSLHGRASNPHQPDKFSPESEMELDRKTLMAALHTYITQNLSAQSNDKSSHSRTKGSLIYADKFYSSQVSPFDGTFAKGKAEDLKMKKLIQPRPASGVLRPSLEMLNHKSNTSRLVDFLNENALPENILEDLTTEKSTKTETKKSDNTGFSSSEEINAGVEDVKSETFTRELTAAKNSESDSKDPNETLYWIKDSLMQDGNSHEKPQNNMGQGLQLEVKSSEEKEYGYIVTVKEIEGNRIVEDSCFYCTVLL
uniref:Uncharacterized protein n=1 Tax=Amazona collaria TaxID=241587 RepID=A0A8B9F1R3_9PSIT